MTISRTVTRETICLGYEECKSHKKNWKCADVHFWRECWAEKRDKKKSTRTSFRNGRYIVSTIRDALRLIRGGAKFVHLANHCRSNYTFLQYVTTRFKRTVLSVPPSTHRKIAKQFREVVKPYSGLGVGRPKFWTRYVTDLIHRYAWDIGEAGAICIQLFYSGIRLTKKALLKWMYRNGLRSKRPPGYLTGL